MGTISKDKAIKILHQKGVKLFSLADAKKLFAQKNDNTLYKIIQRLEAAQVIARVSQGKYQFLLREVDDFELANFLVYPSYVSLESALCFYGILPQFTYTITSVSTLKSRKIIYQDKEYEFAHLAKKYFFGFEKEKDFLLATPEKALLDEAYFVAKKLRQIHFADVDLKRINKKKLKELAEGFSFLPLQNLLKKLKLI